MTSLDRGAAVEAAQERARRTAVALEQQLAAVETLALIWAQNGNPVIRKRGEAILAITGDLTDETHGTT